MREHGRSGKILRFVCVQWYIGEREWVWVLPTFERIHTCPFYVHTRLQAEKDVLHYRRVRIYQLLEQREKTASLVYT